MAEPRMSDGLPPPEVEQGPSDQSPHIRDGHAPLQTLLASALRFYGEFSAETIGGDVAMMGIEFANTILDDIRQHPYARPEDMAVPYYAAISDVRPVDDSIMRAGLLALFAMQQGAEAAGMYRGRYYQVLNGQMWRHYAGNTRLEMRVPDGGPQGGPRTSDVNGLNRLKISR